MSQTVYETVLPLVEQGLTWINKMVNLGILTDALVASSNTVALLKSNLDAATGVFETSRRLVDETTREGGSIDRSAAIGVISDSILAPLTTVAQLQALFTAQDTNIESVNQQHSMVA